MSLASTRRSQKPIDHFLRAVIDGVAEGVLIELADRMCYLNDSYAHFLGYRSGRDLIGATIRDIADPDDETRLTWFSSRRRVGKPAPQRYTFRARRRDSSLVTFDASVSTTKIGADLYIATIVREVEGQPVSDVALLQIPGLKQLSAREYEVFKYILNGRRSKEIAIILDISEKTVATHRHRLYEKLGLRNEFDLVRFAYEHRLLLT